MSASSLACLFATDLHGRRDRYRALFDLVRREPPSALFLGGDLLPHALARQHRDGVPSDAFVADELALPCRNLRRRLGPAAPRVFVIMGNDDPRAEEPALLAGDAEGLWCYVHGRRVEWSGLRVYGYAYVPPTPFLLKDWERYDVSRYVDPGCVSPEEGWRTSAVDPSEVRWATIRDDLRELAHEDQGRAIWLFHAPPYDTPLDRAALDGRTIDHVPLDVHVGSVAVRRFIERQQPFVTLHGHVHEAARLAGTWRTRIGRTHAFQGAHDGPELSVVRFDLANLEGAERLLVGGP